MNKVYQLITMLQFLSRLNYLLLNTDWVQYQQEAENQGTVQLCSKPVQQQLHQWLLDEAVEKYKLTNGGAPIQHPGVQFFPVFVSHVNILHFLQ